MPELNIVEIQDAILEHLDSSLPQRVVEQSIPDSETVLRDSRGNIQNYVAIQFGDLQVKYRGQGFAGVRNDDYELPVYVQAISPDPRTARVIAGSKVLSSLLGMKQDWTGQIRKRPGGGMWPIISSNQATEAYVFPVSFGVTVQLTEVP